MSKVTQLHEWYRYLDAHSDEEAASILGRHSSRLSDVYGDLVWELKQLAGCPDVDVEEMLRLARQAVGDTLDLLGEVAVRFRAGERDAS